MINNRLTASKSAGMRSAKYLSGQQGKDAQIKLTTAEYQGYIHINCDKTPISRFASFCVSEPPNAGQQYQYLTHMSSRQALYVYATLRPLVDRVTNGGVSCDVASNPRSIELEWRKLRNLMLILAFYAV